MKITHSFGIRDRVADSGAYYDQGIPPAGGALYYHRRAFSLVGAEVNEDSARVARTFPCTASGDQKMNIDCPAKAADSPPVYTAYERHTNTFTIGDGTLTVARNSTNGDSTSHSFGIKRAAWHHDDFEYIFWLPAGYLGRN
jgi:hypothetical protein